MNCLVPVSWEVDLGIVSCIAESDALQCDIMGALGQLFILQVIMYQSSEPFLLVMNLYLGKSK